MPTFLRVSEPEAKPGSPARAARAGVVERPGLNWSASQLRLTRVRTGSVVSGQSPVATGWCWRLGWCSWVGSCWPEARAVLELRPGRSTPARLPRRGSAPGSDKKALPREALAIRY
jgi:hypothetical protein